MKEIPKKYKILAVALVLLLIGGGICAVCASKTDIVKEIVIFATGELVEDVINNADNINKEVQQMKNDMGVYERSIEKYREQIAKLKMAQEECEMRINNPNEPKYNKDYCRDAFVRIKSIITSLNYKIEACEQAITNANSS